MKLRRDHSFCHGKCLPAFFSAEWFVDLDHFCTVKATKQNHVWVFFPRESFPVALSFLFLNNKQSIPPSLDNRLNSRRKFDRHLGIDYDWSVDIQSGSHHQSRPPSCLFSFHLENRRTNPPPLPPNTSYAPVFFHSSLVTSTYLIISKFMLSNILQVWVIVRMNSLKDADELLTFDLPILKKMGAQVYTKCKSIRPVNHWIEDLQTLV